VRDKSSALSVTGVVNRWGGGTVFLYSKKNLKRQEGKLPKIHR